MDIYYKYVISFIWCNTGKLNKRENCKQKGSSLAFKLSCVFFKFSFRKYFKQFPKTFEIMKILKIIFHFEYQEKGRDENVRPETSTVDHRPVENWVLLVDVDNPDVFLLVDVDHWAFLLVDVDHWRFSGQHWASTVDAVDAVDVHLAWHFHHTQHFIIFYEIITWQQLLTCFISLYETLKKRSK